jgi:hypothetical protein
LRRFINKTRGIGFQVGTGYLDNPEGIGKIVDGGFGQVASAFANQPPIRPEQKNGGGIGAGLADKGINTGPGNFQWNQFLLAAWGREK